VALAAGETNEMSDCACRAPQSWVCFRLAGYQDCKPGSETTCRALSTMRADAIPRNWSSRFAGRWRPRSCLGPCRPVSKVVIARLGPRDATNLHPYISELSAVKSSGWTCYRAHRPSKVTDAITHSDVLRGHSHALYMGLRLKLSGMNQSHKDLPSKPE
jgi:hypothetical protein